MFSKIDRLLKKRKKTITEAKTEENLMDEIKRYLKELIDILLSSYYIPYLRWWETIIIVVVGVLSGIGVGIMIYSLLKYPQSIVIVFQNGSIVRIPVR